METENKDIEESKSQVEVMEKTPASDVEAFAGLIKSISEPIANSQVVVAQETTKQTQIIANTTKSLFRGLIGVAFAVVVLAGIALFKGEAQLTEKIVIALLGFLGGFGVGKSSSK